MLSRHLGSKLFALSIRLRVSVPVAPCQSSNEITQPAFAFTQTHRLYATAGRPKKGSVGEPSSTVKRNVKRAAKDATPDDAATKKLRANKKTAASKEGNKIKKSVSPKQIAKEKARLHKEKARLHREKIEELKKQALSPPSPGIRLTPYIVFFAQKMKGRRVLGSNVRECAQEWRSLSPAEREHYNHVSRLSSEKNLANYRSWVLEHTPKQILEANSARQQLRHLLKGYGPRSRLGPIRDERHVKGPVRAWSFFIINRQGSGDFKGIPNLKKFGLMRQEWKALSDGEREKYKDLERSDISRYLEECQSVYGMPGKTPIKVTKTTS